MHSIVARWLGLRPPVYSGRSAVRGLSVFPKGHGYDQSHGIHQFVDVGKRAGFVTLNDKEVYWFCGAMCPPKGTIYITYYLPFDRSGFCLLIISNESLLS